MLGQRQGQADEAGGTPGLRLLQTAPELVAQDCLQVVFSISEAGDATASLGTLCQGLRTRMQKSLP